MDFKKPGLNGIVSGAGKATAAFLGKTKEAASKAKASLNGMADTNGDGIIDAKDVSAFANRLGNKARLTVEAAKSSADARTREKALHGLTPLFPDDFRAAGFIMPKILLLEDMDRIKAEADSFSEAVGYSVCSAGKAVISLFRSRQLGLGLSFYPDVETGVYCVDPADRAHFIRLSEYFNYIKKAEISELQKIAQDLGAKHFRITFREKSSGESDFNAAGNLSLKGPASANAKHSAKTEESSSTEIAADNVFPGHAPVRPQLHYLRHEPDILNLIEMRMDPSSPLMGQTYSLCLANSSGIQREDAAAVDGVFNGIKGTASASVSRVLNRQENSTLEYTIEF